MNSDSRIASLERRARSRFGQIAVVICTATALNLALGAGQLERDFKRPPAAGRPWVYWIWMDKNLSREGKFESFFTL